jgi:hypothetical protein
LQQGHPDFLVRDFSAPETQCDLALIAFSQKPFDVAQLDVVVTVIGTGPELDLFDFNDLLLGLGFVSPGTLPSTAAATTNGPFRSSPST